MNELFPIFVKADLIKLLVVGGGEVALEKLHFLMKSSPNANVEVVSISFKDEIINLSAQSQRIHLKRRAFDNRDILEKHLVIAATNNPDLNKRIRLLALRNKVLLNVADKSDLCDFYLGGIVTKGDLKIAISTNGKSPIMAKRLRQFFENELPNSIDDVINSTKKLRLKMNGSFERKLKELNVLTKRLVEK
jgi:precorrin-2 dehydrogenase/sirohydrochlorin ferrochelatase